MKRTVLAILAALLLLGTSVFAKECVCFDLEGEFGEEIKAILMKYAKNLNDKDIKIIKESGTEGEKSFLNSLMGFADAPSGSVSGSEGRDMSGYYQTSCASCHGDKAEEKPGSMRKALYEYESDSIIESIESYQRGEYEGASRFVKKSVTEALTKSDVRNLADYIQTLKP